MELSSIDTAKTYVRLILKKRVLFVAAAILIITTSVIVSYVLPKKYEAQSTVFIERNVISNLVKGIAITPSMEDRLRVLSYSMKSRSLLINVIKALDMDLNTEDQAELAEILEGFQKKTSINIRKGSRGMDLFTISFRDKDPKFARDYVNTLVKLYIEGSVSGKRDEAYGANRFLSEQIEFFKKKLDKTDAEILDFRKEKGIFVSTDERRIVSEIKSTEEKLEELKSRKMELEAKKDSMEKQLKDGKAYGAAGLGESDSVRALQKKLNNLLLNYTENYPEVIRVRAELEALKKGFEREVENSDASQNLSAEMLNLNPVFQDLNTELVKVKADFAAITARENHLKRLIESKKAYLRDIPAEKKKLVDMERQRESNRKIYEELILRHGQSEVSKQMEIQDKGATFNIIDPAVLPTKPVSPNRVIIMLLGIFAGFAGAFGLIFLIDYMYTSIRTIDTLKTLGLPVLAVIPVINSTEDLNKQRKSDVLLFSYAGGYMLFILIILVLELLGLTYIDQFVTMLIMQ